MERLEILDGIIYGRVEPHIYAFETNTIPNFLKVGDTYRPVNIRLNEWKKHYKDLVKKFDEIAKVDDDTYFRDYSVHHYLEYEQNRERIKDDDFSEGLYKSNEFFRDATEKDIEEAIADIQKNFDENSGKYTFYNIDNLSSKEISYIRDADWKPRANQQNVIDNYLNAVRNGRTNLLMYAVMRFGKSFTALCCAKESDAKLVVVVCGKTDVKEEWRKNVLKPQILEGYEFVDANGLIKNPNVISSYLDDNKKVVVFLTLQDLLGDNIKDKHLDLFNLNQKGKIDLLIIDETHFAARSEHTGKVLKDFLKKDFRQEEKALDDSIEELQECVKQFNPKIKLHLSGTPYRILMNDEFTKEDIIAFVQYDDIVREQEKWDAENLDDEEWANPYYGFPQMIRFAFNLNKSSIDRLNQMKEIGIDFHLSTLFRPSSLNKDDGYSYKKFKYEDEVLDLLYAIDGVKTDENIFSFLNYDKIKEGKMCRHIVMVLPFRASCDAMENMLRNKTFNNLNDYEIINVAGLDSPKRYSNTNNNNVINVINDIKKCEENDRKTITLTVGRMLTGSTVEYWDTMIYLKDTLSPQEYDQAIFRLQSQYVKTIKGNDGKEIKYNMKPQTLLVDFDPTRMFVMQNRKSLISNINTSIRGNAELEKRLKEELRISPIILFNKDKMKMVEPTDIIDEVCKYSANKSILDETFDVSVDNTIFDDETFLSLIQKQPEMSAHGTVFAVKPNKGDGDDADSEGNDTEPENTDVKNKVEDKKEDTDKEQKSLVKRLQTYYFKILLFAYLSDLEERTISDIIENIENDDDAKRIANNIQLDIEGLKYIKEKIHPMALNELENKINNIDRLSEDKEADAKTAMRRFSRLSDSEIITPEWIAKDMIGLLPDDITKDSKFLNIAGKTGEFEYAIISRYGDDVKKNIYTIATSGVTYECTRKMFQLLGIPSENLFQDLTSFDLIDKNKNQDIIKLLSDMKFDAVVGNPPYQEMIDINRSLAKQLFPKFIELGILVNPQYLSLIVPSRWFTADGQDNSFPKLREFTKAHNHFSIIVNEKGKKVFPNTELGDVCYFLWTPSHSGDTKFVDNQNEEKDTLIRPLFENGLDIILPLNKLASIAKKIVTSQGFIALSTITTGRDAFGIVGKNFNDISRDKAFANSVEVRCAHEVIRYYEKDKITKNHKILNSYKVFTSKGNGGAGLLTDDKEVNIIGKSYLAKPNTACTDSMIPFGAFNNELEAVNLRKYMTTKFLRFMVGILKVSQNIYQNVYQFVPLQDFTEKSDIDWSKSISEIDNQLYKKYNLTEEEITFIESMIKPME